MKKILPLILFTAITTTCWSQIIDPEGPKTISYGAAAGKPLPNGRTLFLGRFDYFNGTPTVDGLAVVNADGTVDNTFNIGNGAEGAGSLVSGIETYSNGKMIIIGRFDKFNDVARKNIVRLNVDGSVDNTFTSFFPNGNGVLFSSLLQSTGKVVVSGWDDEGWFIKRINADGTVDNTFTVQRPSTGAQTIGAAWILSNDAIMATGEFTNLGGIAGASYIVRLTSEGKIDNTYHADVTGSLYPMAMWGDGSVVGSKGTTLTRLKVDGSTDAGFSSPPETPYTYYKAIIALSDGSFVTGQSALLRKYSSTGVLLTSADTASFDGNAYSIGPDKMITGLHSMSPIMSHVVRNADLGIDKTWGPAMITDANYDYSTAGVKLFQQPDGKLLILAYADFYTSKDPNDLHSIKGIFRINADMSYDDTFTAPANLVKPMLITSDGKMYVKLTSSGGSYSLARLNNDGSKDNSFTPIAGDFDDVADVGGGQLIGTQLNAVLRGVIKRFSDTGTVGTDVDMYVQNGRMSSIDVTPDGKWWLTLSTTSAVVHFGASIQSVKRIFRMNSNGTLDGTYSINQTISQLLRVRQFGDNIFACGLLSGIGVTQIAGSAPFGGLGIGSGSTAGPGHDVAINSQFAYMTLSTSASPADYKISRMIPNGGDENWADLTYRSSLTPVDPMKADELYLMPDGSVLAVGNSQFFHVIMPTAPPPAPTALKLTSKTSNQLAIAWVNSGKVEGYFEVERAINGGSFAFLHTTTADVTTWLDNTIQSSNVYHYRVRGVNAFGKGEYSNVVNSDDPITPPSAPTQLVISAQVDNQVSLAWVDNSNDEGKFEIERSVNAGAFALLTSRDANINTYIDNSIDSGNVYHYRVRAVNGGGNSGYSNTVDADFTSEDGVINGLGDIQTGIQFYPNPVLNELQVQSDEVIQNFTIIRMDGKTIVTGQPNSNSFNINMNDYSTGMYVMKIQDSKGRKILKIFKQ